MNDVLRTIHSRRSIRKFKPEQFSPELLDQIVQAGLYAPSAMNRQPWHLTVVRGSAHIDRLTAGLKAAVARMPDNPYAAFVGKDSYSVNYGAPTVILLSADPAVSAMAMADCALVAQNIFLAAHSLGLGSCWINQLGSACAEPGFRALLTEFGVPDKNHVFACVALGLADGEAPQAPPRKEGTVNYVG